MPVTRVPAFAQAQQKAVGGMRYPECMGSPQEPCRYLRGCTGIKWWAMEHIATVVPQSRLNLPLEKKAMRRKGGHLVDSAQKNTPTNAFYVVNNVPLYKLLQFYFKNIKYQFICIMHSLRYIIYLLSSWGLSCCSLQARFMPVRNWWWEGFPAGSSAQSVGCLEAGMTPCTSASSYLHP